MLLRLSLASICVLALTHHGMAGETPAAPAPTSITVDVKLGDRWDYAYRTTLNNAKTGTQSYVVQDMTAKTIEAEMRTHASSSSRDTVVNVAFDHSWEVVQGPRGKVVNADAIADPLASLKVGMDWTTESQWQPLNATSIFKWTTHGHVNAWETVKLADGQSYDAFKITFRRENAPTEGTGILVMTAGSPTQKVVERDVEWYAPSVNRYVKRTFEASRDGTITQSYTEELTDYKRGD